MTGGGGVETARGGEFGGGIDQPGDNQGQRQQARARRSRRHQLGAFDARVEPEAASDAERGGDIAMRQRPDDLKAFAGRQQLFLAQYRAQRGDLLGLPPRQIGEGAVLDLAGFAVGLAQQDGRG